MILAEFVIKKTIDDIESDYRVKKIFLAIVSLITVATLSIIAIDISLTI